MLRMPLDETGSFIQDNQSVIDVCIDKCDEKKIRLFTFILALGNAADAIEITCVGFIMNQLGDEISDESKGVDIESLKKLVFYILQKVLHLFLNPCRISNSCCVYGNAHWRLDVRFS